MGTLWQVKDSISSDWRELPGDYTFTEIRRMGNLGLFYAYRPLVADELTQEDHHVERELALSSAPA